MKTAKNILAIILVISVLLTTIPTALANNSDVKVKLDGNYITFDTPPCLIGGRTMVPLRAIFEALSATVNWDDSTQTVTAYNEAYIVKCSIGSNEMTVNGVKKSMDVAPMLVNGRTLVPARFIAEAFACKVEWDATNFTVNITSSEIDFSKPKSESTTNNEHNNSDNDVFDKIKNHIKSEGGMSDYDFKIIKQVENDLICFTYLEKEDVLGITLNNNFLGIDETVAIVLKRDELPFFGYKGTFVDIGITESFSFAVVDGKIDISKKDLTYLKVEDLLKTVDIKLSKIDNCLKDTFGVSLKELSIAYPIANEKIVDSTDKIISNSSSSSSNSSSDYYPGSTIPTYTSVTSIALFSTQTLPSGQTAYIYKLKSADDVTKYWNNLISHGWELGLKDDKSSIEIYESGFIKGNQGVVISIYFSEDKVYVVPVKNLP